MKVSNRSKDIHAAIRLTRNDLEGPIKRQAFIRRVVAESELEDVVNKLITLGFYVRYDEVSQNHVRKLLEVYDLDKIDQAQEKLYNLSKKGWTELNLQVVASEEDSWQSPQVWLSGMLQENLQFLVIAAKGKALGRVESDEGDIPDELEDDE